MMKPPTVKDKDHLRTMFEDTAAGLSSAEPGTEEAARATLLHCVNAWLECGGG